MLRIDSIWNEINSWTKNRYSLKLLECRFAFVNLSENAKSKSSAFLNQQNISLVVPIRGGTQDWVLSLFQGKGLGKKDWLRIWTNMNTRGVNYKIINDLEKTEKELIVF